MLKAKYGWKLAIDGIVADEDIFYHILKNRGIDDANRFFNMGKEVLHDPFLLHDMQKAVNRITLAIAAYEPILIFGDYDCDGITAITVLYRALKKLGANIAYDLPDRFSDGYGLNLKAAQEIIEKGYKLVITVDNGITCVDEIEKLQNAGIDCIITDHHEPKESLPKAYAIVHAKLSPDYPWKEMAGVAVAYKLASAVSGSDLDELLDFVMIGTIADLMPLQDENQALVNLGLTQLHKTIHPGLRKLIEHSHLDQLNATAIAFKIAPKINSSGRLGKALDAVKLLITDSDEEANRLILEIEQNHTTRKDLTEDAFLTCERVMDNSNNVLVISSSDLHEGIIGICAQKMAEKYQKTTCVVYIDEEGVGKGSCRSYGGDNILEMLDANSDLLIKYGGHSQAAGLTILKSNLAELQRRLNQNSKLSVKPILNVDMRLKLSTVSIATVKKLEKYSFFTGSYLFENLTVRTKQIMAAKHTKLLVEDGYKSFDAIIFNNVDFFHRIEPGDIIDIVGGLSINQWKTKESLQIMIKDLKCDEFQILDCRNNSESIDLGPDVELTMIIDDDYLKRHKVIHFDIQAAKPATIVVGPLKCLQSLQKISSKEGLGKLYRLIQVNTEIEKSRLSTLFEGSEWIIDEALKVFEELDLITQKDTSVRILTTESKRNLDESMTYRNLIKTKETYDFLSESAYSTLKTYFINQTEALL